ncbi:glycosyltransferase family 4 protein [candidate division WOR-3 bacterium]|nr:glycosyltransferase family 4 protein [candidate division WOR-3 bacterium]
MSTKHRHVELNRNHKKLLFISYFFPPMGLSGVQRQTKFMKYLNYFGWEATVLTSKPRWYYAFDQSLLKEVENSVEIHRVPSLDHFHFSMTENLFLKRKENSLSKFGKSRTFALPDPEIGWVPLCADYALKLCLRTKFDAIMCSVPPFSSSIAGFIVSKRRGIPLVIDFRDPWIDEDLFPNATPFHKKINSGLERAIINHSSLVTVINSKIKQGIDERLGKVHSVVIPHGYDPEDFRQDLTEKKDGFSVCHMGSLWRGRRADVLLEALSLINDKNVKAVFVGKNSGSALEAAERLGIKDRVESLGYLEHREAILAAQKADAMWLYVDKSEGGSVSTGKLFDYLGLGLPILASVSEITDAADVIMKTGAGIVVPPEDSEKLSEIITDLYEKKLKGELYSKKRFPQYERKHLTGVLCAELDKVAG